MVSGGALSFNVMFAQTDLNTRFGFRKWDRHNIQVLLKLAIDIWRHSPDCLGRTVKIMKFSCRSESLQRKVNINRQLAKSK